MEYTDILTGTRIGRLVITGPFVRRDGHRFYPCACDCGNAVSVRIDRLRNGRAKSCGCLRREKVKTNCRTHGECHSPEYIIWQAMKRRCSGTSKKHRRRYHDRGITVCSRWETSFEAFLADVGRRPSRNHSIDRIDNDKGYEPSNVRWATRSEQQNNRHTNNVIYYKGERLTLTQLSQQTGVPVYVYKHRKDIGYTDDEIVEMPLKRRLNADDRARWLYANFFGMI